MGVRYQRSHGRPTPFTYDCVARRTTYGEALCQHVAGPCLEAFVCAQVLAALAPAVLELSLAAAQQVEQERTALAQLWQHRRERAAYEAERAARPYHAVEPEHRLPSGPHAGAGLGGEARGPAAGGGSVSPRPAGPAARAHGARTGGHPSPGSGYSSALGSPTTTAADRKEFVRQIVERVEEVDAQGKSEQVQVQVRIHWVGGGQTGGTLTRPIARFADRRDYAALCERVRTLTETRWSVPAIARQLEADGYAPWRPGRRWTVANVLTLRRQVGLRGHHHRGRSCEALGPDEWWAADLARTLGVARSLLHTWIQRGLVPARQEAHGMHRWIVQANASAIERLRRYHQRDIASETRHRWTDPHQMSSPLSQEQPYA